MVPMQLPIPFDGMPVSIRRTDWIPGRQSLLISNAMSAESNAGNGLKGYR